MLRPRNLVRPMRDPSDGLRVSRAAAALVGLLVLLSALDAATTHIGLSLGASEANPLMSGLISSVGATPAFVAKLAVVLVAAMGICLLGRPRILVWMSLAMAAIVSSNLAVILCS